MRKNQGEDNARLGRIAQLELGSKFERSGLTVTSPNPDLNGIDFVLEEISSIGSAAPGLDRSPEHRKVEMQVKATSAIRPTVRISLSRLDILAKSSRPAVIGIMHYKSSDSEEPRLLRFYMIHLLGDRLSTALRCLRRHGLASTSKMNSTFFSLTARTSEAVPLTPVDLVSAFGRICGTSMPEYARTKAHQLATDGYPTNGRHTFRGMISAPAAEVIDGLLGLKPLTVEQMEHWETRFGMPERLGTGRGTVSVRSPYAVDGTLTVESKGVRIDSNAQMKRAPFQVSVAHDKRIIHTNSIEFVVAANKWDMRARTPLPQLSAYCWAQEMRLAEAIVRGDADISFEGTDGERFSWRNNRPVSASLIAETTAKREVFEAVGSIEAAAGLSGDSVNPEALVEQQHNIRLLAGLIRGAYPMTIEWHMDYEAHSATPEAILALKIPVNQRIFASYFRILLNRSDELWLARLDKFLDIIPLPDSSIETFVFYFERVKRITGMTTVITLLPSDDAQPLRLSGAFGEIGDHLELRFYSPD